MWTWYIFTVVFYIFDLSLKEEEMRSLYFIFIELQENFSSSTSPKLAQCYGLDLKYPQRACAKSLLSNSDWTMRAVTYQWVNPLFEQWIIIWWCYWKVMATYKLGPNWREWVIRRCPGRSYLTPIPIPHLGFLSAMRWAACSTKHFHLHDALPYTGPRITGARVHGPLKLWGFSQS